MRVAVIGATGHIGSYLVPRLVRAGYQVVAVSRGERPPYHEALEWRSVERVTADRDAEDAAGTFGRRIAGLRPDAVAVQPPPRGYPQHDADPGARPGCPCRRAL